MNTDGTPIEIFLRSFVGQAASYFFFVGLLFFVVWKWGANRFRNHRIYTKRNADGKQIRGEIKHTLVTLFIGTITATLVAILYKGGHTKLSTDAAAWAWYEIVLSVVGLIIFNDVWFYGWHRLLHHPRIFKYVHAVHHRSVDVNPFTSYSFHAVEGYILGAWTLPVIMFVPLYLPALGFLQVFGLANNLISHLGYEFLPRWWIKVPGLRWTNSATFHSLHHTKFNGNYGLMFRFWDRVFGTEVPGYEEAFLARGQQSSPTAQPALANGRIAEPQG